MLRTNDFICEVVEEDKTLSLSGIVGSEVERQEPLRRGDGKEGWSTELAQAGCMGVISVK